MLVFWFVTPRAATLIQSLTTASRRSHLALINAHNLREADAVMTMQCAVCVSLTAAPTDPQASHPAALCPTVLDNAGRLAGGRVRPGALSR